MVTFKQRFYPSKWARYDLAVPGTLKLLPSELSRLAHLDRDYREMQVMLFGKPPAFGSIVDELKKLEAEINSLDRKT